MPTWIDQFKVGDEVEFEMGVPRGVNDDGSDGSPESHPRWNWDTDYGSSGKLGYGIVESTDTHKVRVKSDVISIGFWNFTNPGSEFRPGYVTLRKPAAPAVVVKPLYSVPLPTCFPKESIPPSVMASLVDQGERAVRRVLREWPYGKELKYKTVNNTLEWYFT